MRVCLYVCMYLCACGYGRGANELNGEIGVAAYGPLSPDPSYRHSTLSFADRAPVIGVPKAHYTVPPRGWLSGSGGGRPGTEATTRTPSAPSARKDAAGHAFQSRQRVIVEASERV